MMAKTVNVEVHSDPILIMRWNTRVAVSDVEDAFKELLTYLDDVELSVYVLVDLRQSPDFPLVETMVGAATPARHPRLGGWVMIGSTVTARHIATYIHRISGRDNFQWVATEDEALAYVADQLAGGEDGGSTMSY